MRLCTLLLVTAFLLSSAVRAEDRTAQVTMSLEDRLGPMKIDHMGLGQAGLSAEPMWDDRIAEIRALRPKLIRLFIPQRDVGIRYWEISNEPDIGEGSGCPYRFRPESYTRYHQHTVEAILRADRDALVG